jgi:hypothetical protein
MLMFADRRIMGENVNGKAIGSDGRVASRRAGITSRTCQPDGSSRP